MTSKSFPFSHSHSIGLVIVLTIHRFSLSVVKSLFLSDLSGLYNFCSLDERTVGIIQPILGIIVQMPDRKKNALYAFFVLLLWCSDDFIAYSKKQTEKKKQSRTTPGKKKQETPDEQPPPRKFPDQDGMEGRNEATTAGME